MPNLCMAMRSHDIVGQEPTSQSPRVGPVEKRINFLAKFHIVALDSSGADLVETPRPRVDQAKQTDSNAVNLTLLLCSGQVVRVEPGEE